MSEATREKAITVIREADVDRPVTNLRASLRSELADAIEHYEKPLEARVARFIEKPGMHYEKHAVAYLWNQRDQLPGRFLETYNVPDSIFASCKHSFRIPEGLAAAEKIENDFSEALNDALVDILLCREEDQTGGSITEQRAYIFINSNTVPLPAHTTVTYRQWKKPDTFKYINIIESIKGLKPVDCDLRVSGMCSSGNKGKDISLGDFCDTIKAWVQQKRNYTSPDHRYRLLHSTAESPFEKGMGEFLFRKFTGEQSAHRFREKIEGERVDEAFQINNQTIEAIVERILDRYEEPESSIEILWSELPNFDALARTKKLLSDYIMPRAFELIEEHGKEFLERPSPTPEIDFLEALVTRLGLNMDNYRKATEEYVKKPEKAFLGSSRMKLRAKHVQAPVSREKIGDLYRQSLCIYQTLEKSRILLDTAKDTDDKTRAQRMQNGARFLAQRVAEGFRSLEAGSFEPGDEELLSLARLLTSETRSKINSTLDRAQDLAAGLREVEKIAPTRE